MNLKKQMNKKIVIFISLLIFSFLLVSGCALSKEPLSKSNGNTSVAAAKVSWNFRFLRRLKERINSIKNLQKKNVPTSEQPSINTSPKPASFNVGYKLYDFPYQDANGKNKILTTAVWYPTDQAPKEYTYYTLKENLRAGDIKSNIAVNAPVAKFGPYPLFIFSHGGATCGTQSLFLTEYLASRGFIVAAPDYPDDAVVCRNKGSASGTTLQALKFANTFKESNSSSKELLSYFENDWFRFKGLSLAIDKMLVENSNIKSIFYQKINPAQIAAGGHSAGAITTWGVIGAKGDGKIDKRIKAALLLSGGPFPYFAEDFSRVSIPIMIMHGALDPGVNPQYPREIEYQNSNAPKFELIIKRANHGAFANGECAKYSTVFECQIGDSAVQVINKYSLAFLDRFIKGDEKAKAQLEQPDNMLEVYQKEF